MMKKTFLALMLLAAFAVCASAVELNPLFEGGKKKKPAPPPSPVLTDLPTTTPAALKPLVAASKTAKKTDQIILVVANTMTFWTKGADGEWNHHMVSRCGFGKKGLIDAAEKREGDVKTPMGAFPILHAFGRKPNPGTKMKWKAITPNSYWADDVKVPATYNTWVESKTKIGGEHLIDYYQYDYAMAVGYNTDPRVPGRGSAIFVHVKAKDHWTTGGCVSLEMGDMIELLQRAKDGTWIIIVDKAADVANY